MATWGTSHQLSHYHVMDSTRVGCKPADTIQNAYTLTPPAREERWRGRIWRRVNTLWTPTKRFDQLIAIRQICTTLWPGDAPQSCADARVCEVCEDLRRNLVVSLRTFCRAVLCISTDYAVVRCLSCPVSVTFVNCIKTDKYVLKLLSLSGSHTILVSKPN